MKVAAYYRYSTDNKQQRDNSENRQAEFVEKHINANGWYLVDTFVDRGKSGAGAKPELERLESLVRNKQIDIDCVVIDAWSRISRSGFLTVGGQSLEKDLGWLVETGTQLSVLEDNNGQPVNVEDKFRDIGFIVKTFQNNDKVIDTSKEVSKGMITKWNSGKLGWIGPTPVGYSIVKSLDHHSYLRSNDDLTIVTEIFQTILDGGSYRSCIPILEKASRYKADPERHPTASSIKQILRSAIYCGIRTFGVRSTGKYSSVSSKKGKKWVSQNPLVQAEYYREYEAEGFQAAVSYDDFIKVQKILDDTASKNKTWPASKGKDGKKPKYPFTGLLKCGCCNASLSGTKCANKKHKDLINYVCRYSMSAGERCKNQNGGPSRKHIRTDEFETLLKKEFGVLFMKPESHIAIVNSLLEALIEEAKPSKVSIHTDMETKQQQLNSLMEIYSSDPVGMAPMKAKIQQLSKEIIDLQQQSVEEKSENTLLEIARERFNYGKDINEMDGPERLLILYYRIAYIALGIIHEEGRPKEEADKMIAEQCRTVASKVFPVLMKRYDIESIMNVLEDLRLKQITVHFEPGMWRGRARQIPTGLNFNLLVATDNYTDTLVVGRSHQWSIK